MRIRIAPAVAASLLARSAHAAPADSPADFGAHFRAGSLSGDISAGAKPFPSLWPNSWQAMTSPGAAFTAHRYLRHRKNYGCRSQTSVQILYALSEAPEATYPTGSSSPPSQGARKAWLLDDIARSARQTLRSYLAVVLALSPQE
jgi:hypothetical protein